MCEGGHNEVAQAGGLKTDVYFLTVLTPEAQDQGVGRAGPFCGLSPWPLDSCLPFACSHLLPSATSVFKSPLLMETPVTHPSDLVLTKSPL